MCRSNEMEKKKKKKMRERRVHGREDTGRKFCTMDWIDGLAPSRRRR